MSDSFDTINPERHPHGPGSHAIVAGDERQMPDCYPIKGNIHDDGTRLYHRPDSRNYGATRPEIWFDSPSAAETAGFRLAPTHGEGSTGVSYEPGGSNHPCTAEMVEANRAAARAAVTELLGLPATLLGAGPLSGGDLAGGDVGGDADGGDGMAIEPERTAFDPARHPYGVGSRAPVAGTGARPEGYPIKGNVRRDGSRRYHRPDSTAYTSTNAEAWFDSPAAAEAAGFSLAASHPAGADPSRYEPGGDGHGWSREQVGAARWAALHGPAADSSAASAGAGTDDVAPTGLGLAALAGTVTVGAAAFDPDGHPYGIGSHGLLANSIEMPDFHPIKGNVRNDGSRLFHRPDSRSYSVTKPEVWFDSPSAAEAAGFRLAPTHPDGADPTAFEPGGSGHRWSRAEVDTARLRVLHGPDADLDALARDHHLATGADRGTNLPATALATTDLATADLGAGTGLEVDTDGGTTLEAAIDGGAAFQADTDTDGGVGLGTVAVVAGAGAAALAAGAVAGALADEGKTDIEKLVTGTFQLTGGRPGATDDAGLIASTEAGDPSPDLAVTSGLTGGEADTLVSGSPGGDDPALLDAVTDPVGDHTELGLDRPGSDAAADVDPEATREVPAGAYRTTGAGHGGPTDDDRDGSGIGTAAIVAGAAGLGLAGAAVAGLTGGDDTPGEGTTRDDTPGDPTTRGYTPGDPTAGDNTDTGLPVAKAGRQGRQPPIGREQRAAGAGAAAAGAAGAGAAAAGAAAAAAAGAGAGHAAAGAEDGTAAAAGTGRAAGGEGDRELAAAGTRSGAGYTGTTTAVNAGRTTVAATPNRRLGPWAWIGAAAAGVLALGLLLSQCGGSSTNEATGTGDSDSSAGSSSGSTATGEDEDEPAGPETSATTAGRSTTEAATSATTASSATASTSASSATSATSASTSAAAATGDLKAQAVAALSAAGFENVTVEVNAGKVTILGNVASNADSAKAEAALANLAGLSGLENALVVAETPTASAVQADPDYTG